MCINDRLAVRVQAGLFVVLWLVTAMAFAQEEATADSATDVPVAATLRSASFVTKDLDACIAFYRDLLGYHILGEREITAEKSRQVVGATSPDSTVRYVSMAPRGWTLDAPDERAGISFIEIDSAESSPFDQDGERASRAGELVLAHRVQNIEEIAKRAAAMGIPVVASLSPSGSGRSMSMALLDPNGIRVELYEY